MSNDDYVRNDPATEKDPLGVPEMLAQEKKCQRILARRPDDYGARMQMAWCLFLQAIHREGQESVINKIAPLYPKEIIKLTGDAAVRFHRESRWLFAESLKHSYAVSKLSSNPKFLQEAERLKELVKISAGEEMIMDVEDSSAVAISHLTKEISRRPEHRRCSSHRPLRRLPKR